MEHSRRDFLKIAAMLSGTAGISGFFPDSIQRAFAIEPAAGSTYRDAEHIVILMQENRSFDHALGMLQGVRGFNDPRAIRQANGNSVFVQSDAAGHSYAPWRLNIRDTRITWMGSIPHTRESQVDAWNEGHHNGWIEAKRSASAEYANVPMTMGHYTREDLPFYYALADAFTVCDQSYCSVMSSTTPNRSLFWTGTIRDQQHAGSKVFMRNDEIIDGGGMTWKTYPERLQEAGIQWKLYQNELANTGGLSDEEKAWLSNFGCNLLEYFAAYNVEAYPGYTLAMQKQIDSLNREIAKVQQSLSAAKDSQAAAQLRVELAEKHSDIAKLKVSIASSGAARYKQLTEQQRILHNAAFVTNAADAFYRALTPIAFMDRGKQQQMMVPRGDVLHQFRKDVDDGTLPTVSWLTAPERFSDHPMSPWYGAWYVSEVMDILTKNPEVWKKTIFILTYDENDGYFDHAPSFVAADPKRPSTGGASAGIDTSIEYTYIQDELDQDVPEKDARSGPIGMGFRVPTIIASPWSRGGWVNSQLFDHTSTLMFLEHFVQHKFGKVVKEENISTWRRAISGNLTSCFRPYDASDPKLDFLDRNQFVTSIQQARNKEVPSNYRALSQSQIEEINGSPLHAKSAAHQEPGVRPSCPLPYELYADGSLSADRMKFDLRLKAGNDLFGEDAAGSPFNIYQRNLRSSGHSSRPQMKVATYAVKPGDMLHQAFPLLHFTNGQYVIDVHGPNGFYRSFTGSSDGAALQIETSYERRGARFTGSVQVLIRNTSERSLTVKVTDNSYKADTITTAIIAATQTSLILPLTLSHGWYDFTVQAQGSATEARFAGRVETGDPSSTDPLMGSII